jgi:hypothetical protein
MQNMAMIEQERARMAPLVEELIESAEPEQAEVISSTVLNKAVNIRRGLACGRGVSSLCVDCTELGLGDVALCDTRTERIQAEKAAERQKMLLSVHVPGTTLFTVDV